MTVEQSCERAARAAERLCRKFGLARAIEDVCQDARLKVLATGQHAPVIKGQRAFYDWCRKEFGRKGSQRYGVPLSGIPVEAIAAPPERADEEEDTPRSRDGDGTFSCGKCGHIDVHHWWFGVTFSCAYCRRWFTNLKRGLADARASNTGCGFVAGRLARARGRTSARAARPL